MINDQPGPELDRVIGQKLFNLRICKRDGEELWTLIEGEGNGTPVGYFSHPTQEGAWSHTPAYSTTWSGMQLVVEEMQRRGMSFTLKSWPEESRYYANFDKINGQFADTAPHAVCMAALSALEGQDNE